MEQGLCVQPVTHTSEEPTFCPTGHGTRKMDGLDIAFLKAELCADGNTRARGEPA